MNITERQQKLIEKYLDENLNDEQTQEFNEALKVSPFREQLLFQARMIDASKDIGKARLRKELDELAQSKKKQPINRRNLFLLLGIIGLYLCFLYAYKLMQPDTTGAELYAQYFVELPPDVSKRGTQNEMALEYQRAMQFYIDKDYRSAILAFENLSENSEDIELYKAMCRLQMEDNKMAKRTLMPLLKSKDRRIRQNATWYLILLSVRESDFNKAKESLNYVIQNENHLFRKQAERLKAEFYN